MDKRFPIEDQIEMLASALRGRVVTPKDADYDDLRAVALANKRELRRRLHGLAEDVGAKDPDTLADQLLLLMEGAYSMGNTLGREGPPQALPAAAEALIEAQLP